MLHGARGLVVPAVHEMETQWAAAPNLMSVSCSGGWVNDGLGDLGRSGRVGSLGGDLDVANLRLWRGSVESNYKKRKQTPSGMTNRKANAAADSSAALRNDEQERRSEVI